MFGYRRIVFVGAVCAALSGCGGPAPTARPTADAGPDQIVQVGDVVTLDAGASSVPDASTLGFAWSFAAVPAGSGAELADPTAVSTSFVPDLAGDYRVHLGVSVGGASDTDTVTVTAEPSPDVPTLEPVETQRTTPGTPIEVPFAVAGEDHAGLGIDAGSSDQELLPDAAIEVAGGPGAHLLRLNPTGDRIGSAQVTVIVRNAANLGSSTTFTLLVADLFAQHQRLPDEALPPTHYDAFGAAVAITGARALVGAPRSDHDGTRAGVVHAYVRGEEGWQEVGLLQPSEPPVVSRASVTDLRFGSAIAMAGNDVLVGAPRSTIAGVPGAVYLFRRCNPFVTMCPQPYVEELVLTGDATDHADEFGFAVAIEGDVAVVGARSETIGERRSAGAVYVFERTGTAWSTVHKLVPPDPGGPLWFGYSVAIEGDRLIVADNGAAHVFDRGEGTWEHVDTLDPSVGNVAAVAFDGGRVAVSTFRPIDDLGYRPSVYLFEEGVGGLVERARIQADETGLGDDSASHAIALEGSTLLLGIPRFDPGGAPMTGAVDVYAELDGAWTAVHRASVDGGLAPYARFGHSVALSGGYAIAGAPGHPSLGEFDGAAFGLHD